MTTHSASSRRHHPLDEQLAASTLWAWYKPMFEIGIRHWPITVGAFLAVYAFDWMTSDVFLLVPWKQTAFSLFRSFVFALIGVVAYRLLAEKESAAYTCNQLNSWPDSIVRIGQAMIAWILLTIIAIIAVSIAMLVAALVLGGVAAAVGATFLIVIFATFGTAILIFLLAPIWLSIAVAGSLSTAHAVRSDRSGFSTMWESLRVALDQKWRVFWPSYVLVVAVLVFQFVSDAVFGLFGLLVGNIIYLLAISFGASMTFVIERVYTPWLGEDPDAVYETDPEPESPDPVGRGAAPVALAAAAAAPAAVAATPATAGTPVHAAGPAAAAGNAAADPASPAGLAGQVEEALKANRTQDLTTLVEQGLKADPRFYAAHADSTLALSKRMAQAQRPDLALRVLTPFVKEHRGHKLHLTGALFAANLLIKDARRLNVAAKFIAQLKSLYPNEPMVDQLAKQTAKAIEIANAST